MADGAYERRGGREAELKRFERILSQLKSSSFKSGRMSAGTSVGSSLDVRKSNKNS